MLISVVVPVYNVEKYVGRCISSILGQTYKDFELILVDDGSRDGSGALCDDYAARDARVRVVHKENGGVSSARNLGIAMAKGEYIAFVDSDDWLETDYFEQAAEVLLRERPRLLMNNYVKDDGAGTVTCKFPPSADIRMGAAEAFHAMITGFHLGWELFASFYEAKSCKKVKVPEDIVYGEDLLFRFRFTKTCPGLYVYHRLLKYHYFIRPGSAVQSYGAYKKVDDLKVLEQVMAETMPETARLVLGKEYAPRLVTRLVAGMRSSDERDRAAAKLCREKIRAHFFSLLSSPFTSLMIKVKLTLCLLPPAGLRLVDKMYRLVKRK